MAQERVERRLAAILAADVVGYSRLMRADEAGTLAQLKTLRKELLDPKITEYGGRVVKTTGDGILIEFPSAVNGVQYAVDVQQAMAQRNATVPEDRRMEIRMGINVGDVIVEDDDLFGDGVNVASRLEGLADPGGICVSGSAHEHVRHKLDMAFEDMGEQSVKNIDEPVRVYRIGADGRHRTKKAADEQERLLPDKPSIAVLPFDNLSSDPEQEYFSDGITEDIITDLSKISGLFVIARNSSFAFKGQKVDVKEIAGKLGVKHILEGSVRKMAAKLRVNAQLIDAASGGHIWAERYDGDMADIFEFQDNIREQIVSALQVSLTPTDKALTESKPTDSVEAYDLFLRGRAEYFRYTPEHLLAARKCLEKAIEIDPNFADAYGYLSYCHFQGWAQMWPGFDDNLDRANELAERGVALDGASAIALTRLGWIQAFLRRYDQALANLEKAILLAPDNADVNATFGQVLNYWGDPERGLRMQEKAFSIDTVVPPNWEMQMGLHRLLLRQYDEAVAGFNRAIERAPGHTVFYLYLAWAYVELDRLDDAKDAIKTVLEISPQWSLRHAEIIFVFRIDEVRDRLLDSLRKAGLPEG